MLRKVLSPDITPPLSDEELDNNHIHHQNNALY